MSVYTPPALDAVDFALTAFTPADITPYEVALSSYTPPALNAVDFALTTYTAPTFQDVGWELLPSVEQIATITTAQGGQTTDITALITYAGSVETGQGSQSTNGVLSGETLPVRLPSGGARLGGRFFRRPSELTPYYAEKRVIAKVANDLGIRKDKAAQAVRHAKRVIETTYGQMQAVGLAYSPTKDGWDRAQIAIVKAYWKQLYLAAKDIAEVIDDDDDVLLVME